MSKRTKPHFKPNKTYEEYIKLFKESSDILGRALYKTEIEIHKFDLPGENYFIKNCPNKDINTYNDFLIWLGYEPNYTKKKTPRRYTYEIAFEEFAKKNFILLPQEYKSCSAKLTCICPKHPNIIQSKTLNEVIFHGHGCRYCFTENNFGENTNTWKGGFSSLNIYLREFITEWKKDSMSNCNYKCVITGKKFDDIHHLYSFNKIVKEVIEECKLPTYTSINEYTEDELNLIKETNIKIHKKYPLGTCLSKKVHSLYHNIYSDDNTPEQFEEFKVRYHNGEFREIEKQYKNSYAGNKQFNVYRKSDNSYIMTSYDVKDCIEKLGIRRIHEVNRCLNKKQKYYKDFLFYYIDEDPNLNRN